MTILHCTPLSPGARAHAIYLFSQAQALALHLSAGAHACCLWCRRVVALTGIHAPAVARVCCMWRRRVVALTGIHAPADSPRGLLSQPSGILLPPCLGVCLPSPASMRHSNGNPPTCETTPRSGPHCDELPNRGQGEYRVVTHLNPERGRSLCGPSACRGARGR